MATRDLVNDVKVVKSLQPAATTSTRTGTSVDLFGFRSAMVLVHVGAYTDGTHTPSLEDSDDDSSFSAVTALQGSFTAVSGSGQQNAVYQVGYIGAKRYIRPKVTVSGATSGALIAVSVIKGHPDTLPVS